jgi:hypothetical protein
LTTPVGIDHDYVDPGIITNRPSLHNANDAISFNCDNSGSTRRDIVDELSNVGGLGVGQAATLLEQSNGWPDIGQQEISNDWFHK